MKLKAVYPKRAAGDLTRPQIVLATLVMTGCLIAPLPVYAFITVPEKRLVDEFADVPIQWVQNRSARQSNPFPPQRPQPGRPDGRPQRDPWGVGRGGRVFPGWQPPVYVDEHEPPYRPIRPRGRPIPVIEDDDDYEPVVRRPRQRRRAEPPVRVARPPRIERPARTEKIERPPVVRPPARTAQPQRPRIPPVIVPQISERRLVKNEILVELRSGVSATTISQRHRLILLSTDSLVLADATLLRLRIEGDRSARQVLAQMAGDARIVRAQPNYVYALQQGEQPLKVESTVLDLPPPEVPGPVVTEAATLPVPTADPASKPEAVPVPERKQQYVLGKMGIEEIHLVSKGAKVRVAVIDTGADDQHPELNGVIARQFDALGGHNAQSDLHADSHGTAMAGAIVAKATLRGISPGAELLMARAFAGPGTRPASGVEGTTYHILKSLDWAHSEKARVVNLSFSGPQDRLLSRALEGASAKGMITVAAAGNGGPKAQPSYPAADPSVIAVTATDADDKIFPQATSGTYIAVAAPGVDVISAEPLARYGFSSGTSVAAAHVSGLIALMLEQNPDLDLQKIRGILSETALDLGAKGHDRVFGAGRINAKAALMQVMETSAAATPQKK